MSIRLLSIRSKLTNISTSISEKLTLPEKYKGTILEKWANYWKGMFRDYREVGVNVIKESREKPLKATIYGTIGLTTYLCAKNNPDGASFMDEFLKWNSLMLLVAPTCHRQESADYIKMLQESLNHGTLRFQSLGVCTIMWIDNYDKDVNIYKAMCEYLGHDYLTFHERIIDVGFWNSWWTLTKKMQDYDVA